MHKYVSKSLHSHSTFLLTTNSTYYVLRIINGRPLNVICTLFNLPSTSGLLYLLYISHLFALLAVGLVALRGLVRTSATETDGNWPGNRKLRKQKFDNFGSWILERDCNLARSTWCASGLSTNFGIHLHRTALHLPTLYVSFLIPWIAQPILLFLFQLISDRQRRRWMWIEGSLAETRDRKAGRRGYPKTSDSRRFHIP